MPVWGGARACIEDTPGPEPDRALTRVPRYGLAVCEARSGRAPSDVTISHFENGPERERGKPFLPVSTHLPSALSGYRARHHATEAQVGALFE